MAMPQAFSTPDNPSITTSTEATVNEDSEWYIPPWALGIGGVGMCVLILLGVVGNLLVIISYFKDKQLQTVHNLYILNLAIADLFIGAISMIFYADFTLKSWNWVFGRVFCKMWCVNDYTMCLMSVLLILLLSLDRVILLRNGAEYIVKETKKVALVKIGIAWVIAFGFYGPCVIFWDIARGHSVVEDGDCEAEFILNVNFTLITAVFELTLPFVGLSCLNYLVFVAIRKRLQIFPKGNHSMDVRAKHLYTNQNTFIPNGKLKEGDRNIPRGKLDKGKASPHSEGGAVSVIILPKEQMEDKVHHETNKNVITSKQTTARKDLKAAKSLAVLVITFFICWAPYTISTVALAQCDDCLNKHVYEFFTWLLWAKSSINPFLYASQSKTFQRNFIRLLPVLKFCVKKDSE
ncbi:histamine H3 receptor-like [Haliotis asinina]|uniref:histamine H3 receptor-like n=1 Tax=Haliotis asinina TaxID=109174 RepID=UPI003531E355